MSWLSEWSKVNVRIFQINEGIIMIEQTQIELLEPAEDKYTIILSMIESQNLQISNDSIKTMIDGKEVLIKIPNIS